MRPTPGMSHVLILFCVRVNVGEGVKGIYRGEEHYNHGTRRLARTTMVREGALAHKYT